MDDSEKVSCTYFPVTSVITSHTLVFEGSSIQTLIEIPMRF